jgi:phenylacetate-CoA ligase
MPLMTAGAECFAYLGSGCGKSPGAHLAQDWSIVQAVDPSTGLEVPDGEWGNLVVTTLDRDNGLLRYDLEEACAIMREPCPCGETTIRGLWGGRFKDLIACQGHFFQANEVESALRSVGEVAEPTVEWQMVRPTGDLEHKPLRVRVEVGASTTTAKQDVGGLCAAAIQQALGIETVIEVLDRETLPRAGYKTVRVVEQ